MSKKKKFASYHTAQHIIDAMQEVQNVVLGGRVYLRRMRWVAPITWMLLTAPGGGNKELQLFNKILFERLMRGIRRSSGLKSPHVYVAPSTQILKDPSVLGYEECRKARVDFFRLLIKKGWRKDVEFMLEHDYNLSAEILDLLV